MSQQSVPVRSGAGDGVLKVAVVGCGGIGPRHAEAYAGTGTTELVGVADVIPDRAAAFADRFGPTVAYPSVTALLADQQPDLISIATPPGTHAEIAVEALKAGASVLIEKPPCPTLAEMDLIAEAEAGSAGAAYVVFQHRHGSGAQRAAELLKAGALGQPQLTLCETLWFRPDSYFDPDWRGTWTGEGGGPTLGHGIHQIDLMLHLLGPWQTLTGHTRRVARPVEFEDISLAMLGFEDGSVGSVVNSLLSPEELSRIRIDLTGGTLEVNHVYGYRDADWSFHPAPGAASATALGRDPGVRTDAGDLAAGGDGQRGGNVWEASAGTDLASNHTSQITRLVEDLIVGRTHQTTLASARPTMEFITGLYASALTGGPVRREDLCPGHPFYADLSGGLDADQVTQRMATLR